MAGVIYRKQLIREGSKTFLGNDFEKVFKDFKRLETDVLTKGNYNARGYLSVSGNIERFLEEVDSKYYFVERKEDGTKKPIRIERDVYYNDFSKTVGKRIKRFRLDNKIEIKPDRHFYLKIDHYNDRVLDIAHIRAIETNGLVFPEIGKDITGDLNYRVVKLVK